MKTEELKNTLEELGFKVSEVFDNGRVMHYRADTEEGDKRVVMATIGDKALSISIRQTFELGNGGVHIISKTLAQSYLEDFDLLQMFRDFRDRASAADELAEPYAPKHTMFQVVETLYNKLFEMQNK